jgi:hypothetical protein
MSKLKLWKSKHESWTDSPRAIGHVVNHGWSIKWKPDNIERVGDTGNFLTYAEFEYGYSHFRKRVRDHYKRKWRLLMWELYGDIYHE